MPWWLIGLAVIWACAPSRDGLTFLVSPKGLTHDFWVTVKQGAEAAGKELGVTILWNGPSLETDVAGQIAIIEDHISMGVDAIVMAACDASALVPVIARADRAGIPVVTIDSGVDSEIPRSFVATDNIAGARMAARTLVSLIGGRGKVACIPFVPGAATSNMREEGFVQEIAQYPGMAIAAVLYSQSQAAVAMAVTEDILTTYPDIQGVFAANEAGAIGAAQALQARGVQGRVKLVAFDAAPPQIQALQDGVIQALVVQNPFQMGYTGVKTAWQVIQGQEVPRRIDTGVTVVTAENLHTPAIQAVLHPDAGRP